jgi:hypothetical protein
VYVYYNLKINNTPLLSVQSKPKGVGVVCKSTQGKPTACLSQTKFD